MRKNEFQFRVNWGDTDKAEIVYYPNYFKWFDIAGHQFFRSADLSPITLEKERDIILPILDVQGTFKKPAFYDDILTINTEVSSITNKTIKLAHKIRRDEDELIAFGYEIRAWTQKGDDGIQSVPIPDDIRRLLEENNVPQRHQNPWLMA